MLFGWILLRKHVHEPTCWASCPWRPGSAGDAAVPKPSVDMLRLVPDRSQLLHT